MLRTRLIVGTSLIALLVGLSWLDHGADIPGMWLAPVLIALAVLATQELLRLFAAKGLRPIAAVVHLGTLLVLLSPWMSAVFRFLNGRAIHSFSEFKLYDLEPIPPWEGWCAAALVIAVVMALLGEMARYEKPGRVIEELAATVFAFVYLGLLLSFVVRLRLVGGIGGLASLVIVVKMGDTGAYFVGKAFGRHRMTPRLSPSKTIEGAIGAILFSCLASWAVFRWLVPATAAPGAEYSSALGAVWGSIVFGVLVAVAGIVGDLAESLLKRDAACKDSSTWIPGLGGVLDLLDSVILAAPVAYACWHFGLIG